ncbi:MAG: FemAB family XrtA/PEP-CTERM system-associated protein [Pseudomonadota bacterium]
MIHTRIDTLETADQNAWLDFIKLHPQATAYHHPGWLQATEQAYSHKGWLLSAWQDRSLVGILPVCQLRRPGRDALVSLPFCDLGGALTLNRAADSALAEAGRTLLEHLGLGYLETRCLGLPLDEEQEGESQVHPEQQATVEKVSMQADLPATPEILFAGFRAKLRSQIRKAEKNGLTATVETGNEGIDAFYPVFAANMRRLGSPVHAKGWFQALQQAYGAQLLVGVVRLDSTVVAAGVVLVEGNHACIPWASTLAEYNHLAPNMLLYWHLLSRVIEMGGQHFDFGRSTPGEGTYRFKRQWGAHPVELLWQSWQADGSVMLADKASPGALARHSRQLAEACWQRLPLTLANRIGPHLRKHISL